MAFVNGKCCCNCQYWNGPRRVGVFKDKADVKQLTDVGVCVNSSSVQTKGRQQKANQLSTCNRFEKWDQLR